MARARHPRCPAAVPSPALGTRRWPKPPAELVRFVRALAVDDARRDHDASLAAARRPGTDGPDSHPKDRSTGRR